jgi:hypothetical protein
LPHGAWVVDVFTRLGVPESGPWNPNQAIGRDHLWVRSEERDALLGGKVAPDLTLRLARFHLLDNVRGEPEFWQLGNIKNAKLTVEKGKLAGAFLLRSGKAGIELRMQGVVSARRFDAVAWGEAWGRGAYTPGEPPGRFPIAIGFSLAAQNDPARLVPPQGMKDFDGYGIRSSSQ